MGAASPIAEFAEYRRRFGLRRSFARAGYVLGHRILRVAALDCLRLTRDELPPECLDRSGQAFDCRFLSDSEVRALAADGRSGLPRGVSEDSLRNGDRCFAILDGDRLASYGWYARRPAKIMDDWVIRFDPAYAYMYRGYTSPDYRGLRLHALGVGLALEQLNGEGIAGLLSNCERTNYRSWVSVARMGWTRCGTFYRFDLGSRAYFHASARCADFGMSAGRIPSTPDTPHPPGEAT